MRGGDAARLHHRIRASSGMFTAELAIGLLAVVPLVLALVALVVAGAVQVTSTEAARTGARMLARGDSEAQVRDELANLVPAAQVQISQEPGFAVVEVRHGVGGAGLLPSFTLRATARSPREG